MNCYKTHYTQPAKQTAYVIISRLPFSKKRTLGCYFFILSERMCQNSHFSQCPPHSMKSHKMDTQLFKHDMCFDCLENQVLIPFSQKTNQNICPPVLSIIKTNQTELSEENSNAFKYISECGFMCSVMCWPVFIIKLTEAEVT